MLIYIVHIGKCPGIWNLHHCRNDFGESLEQFFGSNGSTKVYAIVSPLALLSKHLGLLHLLQLAGDNSNLAPQQRRSCFSSYETNATWWSKMEPIEC